MFNEINNYLRQKKPDIFEGKVITKDKEMSTYDKAMSYMKPDKKS